MKKITSTEILKGSSGKVWLNGEQLANLDKIQIKLTANFSEEFVVGSFGALNVYTGFTGSGNISLKKIDSKLIKILGDAYKTGVMPELKIITSLTSATKGTTERVAISDVVITEFNLADFDSNSVIIEELPIKFSEYEILETI